MDGVPPGGFPGRFYDGRLAVAHVVTLQVGSHGVDVMGSDVAGRGDLPLARWPRDGLRLGPAFREAAGLTLTHDSAPDARAVVQDRAAAEALAALLPDVVARRRRSSRRVVGRYATAILALVAVGAFVVHQLPVLVAPVVPEDTKVEVGHAVADLLFPDSPECRAGHGVAALDALGDELRLAAGIERPLEIRIVDHPMVNAFAAPGGVVMLTRGLIESADGPDEVAGVLAHEIGHVQHDHATVGVLRRMGITALLQLLTAGSGAETLAGFGGTLAFLSYSRAAEEEADAAGIVMLERSGRNADGLARFFAALQEREGEDDGGVAGLIPSWLSTHPPTEARHAASLRRAAGTPALSEADWQSLRAACPGRTDGRSDKRSRSQEAG